MSHKCTSEYFQVYSSNFTDLCQSLGLEYWPKRRRLGIFGLVHERGMVSRQIGTTSAVMWTVQSSVCRGREGVEPKGKCLDLFLHQWYHPQLWSRAAGSGQNNAITNIVSPLQDVCPSVIQKWLRVVPHIEMEPDEVAQASASECSISDMNCS